MATKIDVNLKVTITSDDDDIDEILSRLTEHVEDMDQEYDVVDDVEINDWKKSDT